MALSQIQATQRGQFGSWGSFPIGDRRKFKCKVLLQSRYNSVRFRSATSFALFLSRFFRLFLGLSLLHSLLFRRLFGRLYGFSLSLLFRFSLFLRLRFGDLFLRLRFSFLSRFFLSLSNQLLRGGNRCPRANRTKSSDRAKRSYIARSDLLR